MKEDHRTSRRKFCSCLNFSGFLFATAKVASVTATIFSHIINSSPRSSHIGFLIFITSVPEVFANPHLPISLSFVKANCFFSPFLCFACKGAPPTRAQVVTNDAQVILSLIYLFQFKVSGF